MAAAVSADITLDELRKFVPKFVNATTKEVGQELIRQARLLVRDSGDNGLLAITPPKDEAEGVGAVTRDINRVFVSVAVIRKILADSGVRGVSAAFSRYMKQGGPNYSEARALDLLNNQTPTLVEVRPYTTKKGKRVNSYTQTRKVSAVGEPKLGNLQYVGQEPNRNLHKSRQNSQGRVNQAHWSQLVVSKGKMNSYTKKMTKRVGTLKAGWGAAWKDLGLVGAGALNLPEFVSNNLTRGSGKGRRSFGNPLNMYIEMANTAKNASDKIRQGRVNWLLEFRQKQIEREMNNRLGKLAKAA
jgi:hypothetical protein